jgi:hypothetical protein
MIPCMVGPALSVYCRKIQTVAAPHGLSEIAGCVERCGCSVVRKPQAGNHLPKPIAGTAVFDPMPCMGSVVGYLPGNPLGYLGESKADVV